MGLSGLVIFVPSSCVKRSCTCNLLAGVALSLLEALSMPEADEDYIKEARQELQMQNTKDQLVRVAGTIPNSNFKL